MKLLQVLIFLCLFSKILANPNPNEDEFSESGEDSFSENDTDEDDGEFNSTDIQVGIPEHKFDVKEVKILSGKKKGEVLWQINYTILKGYENYKCESCGKS